ncbi:GNAT family N-acetyltransferase [Shigella flexneri]
MIELLSNKSLDINQLAKICLENKLFQKGLSLEPRYRNILENKNNNTVKIVILKENNIPVGVCYYDKLEKLIPVTLQVFVNKDYRKKGYGYQVVKEMVNMIEDKDSIRIVANHNFCSKLIKDNILNEDAVLFTISN